MRCVLAALRENMNMAEDRVGIFLIDAGDHPDRVLVVLSKVKGLLMPPQQALKKTPCLFATNIPKSIAEKLQRFLQQAGATVALAEGDDVAAFAPPPPSPPEMSASIEEAKTRRDELITRLLFSEPHNGTPEDEPIEARIQDVQRIIQSLLPQIMQQTVTAGTPIETILSVMASFVTPLEDWMRSLDALYDAERTEPRFVLFLAQCVNIAWVRDAGISLNNLRRLIANSRELSLFRGTAEGLRRFLELATGVTGFEIRDHGRQGNQAGSRSRPFHLDVLYPPQAGSQLSVIRRIVDHEKPAYMTFDAQELEITT